MPIKSASLLILLLLISLISSAKIQAVRLPAVLSSVQKEKLADELGIPYIATPSSTCTFIDVEVSEIKKLRLWKFYYISDGERFPIDGSLTATNTLPDLQELKGLVHSPIIKVTGNARDELKNVLESIRIPMVIADKGNDFILKGEEKDKKFYISLYNEMQSTLTATLISSSFTEIASFVYEHILHKHKNGYKSVLFVDSIPRGVDLTVDSRLRVRTPVVLNDISTGIHEFKVFNETQYAYLDGEQKVLILRKLIYPKVLLYSKHEDLPIEIDGKDYGKIPVIVKGLKKGKHRIKIEDKKFKAVNEYVNVENDYFQMIEIEVKKIEEKKQQRFGQVDITSNWKAEVYIDNVMIGMTPVKDLTLSFGKHRIHLIKKGYEDINEIFTVDATNTILHYKMKGLPGTIAGRFFVGSESVENALLYKDTLLLYYGNTIKVYKIEDEEPLWKRDIGHPITSARVIGKSLILTTFDGNIYSLSQKSGNILSELEVKPTLLKKTVVLNDKKISNTMIWLSSDYGYLYLIEMNNGILKLLWQLDVRNPLRFIGMKTDTLYAIDVYGNGFAMDVRSRIIKWKINMKTLIKSCVFKNDEIYAVTKKALFEVGLNNGNVKKFSSRIPPPEEKHEEGIDLGEGLMGVQGNDGYFILVYR